MKELTKEILTHQMKLWAVQEKVLFVLIVYVTTTPSISQICRQIFWGLIIFNNLLLNCERDVDFLSPLLKNSTCTRATKVWVWKTVGPSNVYLIIPGVAGIVTNLTFRGKLHQKSISVSAIAIIWRNGTAFYTISCNINFSSLIPHKASVCLYHSKLQ